MHAESGAWRDACRYLSGVNQENVKRLNAEIDGIRQGNDFNKAKIGQWKYPEYFFKK